MLVIKNLAWNIDEKAGEKSFGMIRYSNQKNTYAFVHEYEVVESRIMRLLDISPKQLILMSEYSELEFIPSGTISSVILRGKNPLMPVMKMWTTCYVEESR